MLNLLDKDFQSPIWNILKKLMEMMHEGMKIMFHQIQNIKKYMEIIYKEPHRN